MLTERQLVAYRNDGFIVVADVFSPAEIAELRAATDDFVRASAQVTANDEIYDLEDTHSAAEPRVRRIKAPHAHHDAYRRASRQPIVVKLLEELWGSVRFDTGKLNMKSAGYGAPIEWHQDWAFYPHTNDDLAAVGIMIDDFTMENGPMMVIPGSHKGPIHDHHGPDGRFCGAMDPHDPEIDYAKALPCLGKAGSVTIHHVRAVHGSATNFSGAERRFLLYQYRAADAWPLLGLKDGIDKFNEQLLVGEPSLAPRLSDVPVRMPLPPAAHQGSIYENQRATGRRFFETAAAERCRRGVGLAMPGPLDGFRIVDLTSNVAGPLGTMILGDQGADVIKVEAIDGGDHTRTSAQKRGGFSTSFLNNNRNKRSIALDLKSAAGRRAFLRLCQGADAVVQNFRPGVVERLGIDEAAVRAVAPTIVYVSISGFGEVGPYAHKPTYDPIIQAYSGLATVQAGADDVRPRMLRTILPDKLTAITASQAITAALLARERTGQGQHVRLAMLEAVLAFLWASDFGDQTLVGDEPPSQEKASATDLVYETADGWITVAVQTDQQWAALTRALDKPEWLDDVRFTTPALRHQNVEARLALTQAVLSGGASERWLDRLTAAGVPCAPVLTRNQVMRAPQVEALGLVVETDHPGAGRLRQTRAAARFSGTPTAIRRGAPALGEHSDDILAEAGYTADEIAGLHADGVVAGGQR